jgi:hypothetical protein
MRLQIRDEPQCAGVHRGFVRQAYRVVQIIGGDEIGLTQAEDVSDDILSLAGRKLEHWHPCMRRRKRHR